MNKYTVVGIYADNNQPYATDVSAENPDGAIEALRYILEPGTELRVAAVLEGDCKCVDNMGHECAVVQSIECYVCGAFRTKDVPEDERCKCDDWEEK